MPREVIAHTRGCEGGNCATFWRNSDTGFYEVQGLDPTDPTGKRERIVQIAPEDWAYLVAQLPR